jgi:hypothetical protein
VGNVLGSWKKSSLKINADSTIDISRKKTLNKISQPFFSKKWLKYFIWAQ